MGEATVVDVRHSGACVSATLSDGRVEAVDMKGRAFLVERVSAVRWLGTDYNDGWLVTLVGAAAPHRTYIGHMMTAAGFLMEMADLRGRA